MSYCLLAETTRVARKPHRCIWCDGEIAKGESYREERSTYDGRFQHHHWHSDCHEASSDFFTDECEFCPGMFKRGTCEER